MAQLKTGSTVNGEVIATQTYVDTATNTTSLGAIINGATAKTTPVDADMLPLMDSAVSNVVKKLSWANIKTALGGLYAASTHTHGNLTNSGTIGSTPNLPIFTGEGGLLETKSVEDVQALLGVAPHPASHPASMITGLPTSLPASGGNADTVGGFTVGVNVPAGAKFTDTVYTHPASHPPSVITQDASNRFVTDAEKAAWNGKANPPIAVTATLSTTWTGLGPYTQSVTVSGVTSTNNITVSLASTATEAERSAARDALLSATAQATNSITVTADGDKPTVALPIQVLILGG